MKDTESQLLVILPIIGSEVIKQEGSVTFSITKVLFARTPNMFGSAKTEHVRCSVDPYPQHLRGSSWPLRQPFCLRHTLGFSIADTVTQSFQPNRPNTPCT